MPTIELREQPVELYKLLKFEGLAASGGEAKAMIADGLVQVNGDTETRKRKKIVAGDIVEFDSESYTITLQSKPDNGSADNSSTTSTTDATTTTSTTTSTS